MSKNTHKPNKEVEPTRRPYTPPRMESEEMLDGVFMVCTILGDTDKGNCLGTGDNT